CLAMCSEVESLLTGLHPLSRNLEPADRLPPLSYVSQLAVKLKPADRLPDALSRRA
ncbi:unnamed protein product, partial [Leptidea sinapis]